MGISVIMFILNFAAKTATLSDDVEMETVFGMTTNKTKLCCYYRRAHFTLILQFLCTLQCRSEA